MTQKTLSRPNAEDVLDFDALQEEADDYTEMPSAPSTPTSNGTTLATIPANIGEVFKPGGTAMFIQAVREEAAKFEPDISTSKGRRELKSFAAKVVHTKTFAEKAGRAFVAEQKANLKVWDAEIRKMCDELDAIRDEVRKPLTDWEDKDKERIAQHERALEGAMKLNHEWDVTPTPELIRQRLVELETIEFRDWDEFDLRASKVIGNVKHNLNVKLAAAEKAEADRIELDRLRKEAAEREQRDRDERIKAETEARVKREAEEAARARIEAAEQARIDAEARAKAEADAAARKAKAVADKAEAARKAEEQAKIDAEARAAKAERERQEAIEASERARLAAEAKAKADREAAVEAERKRAAEAAAKEAARLKAENDAKAAAEKKRQADVEHRRKINGEIVVALREFAGMSDEQAKAFVAVVVAKKIPHVSIAY